VTVAEDLDHLNIIEETWFSNTDYYDVLEAFWDGMSWPTTYPNADSCREQLSALLTDFYFLDQNHTSNAGEMELDFFNVTGIIATSFAETLNECYQFQQ